MHNGPRAVQEGADRSWWPQCAPIFPEESARPRAYCCSLADGFAGHVRQDVGPRDPQSAALLQVPRQGTPHPLRAVRWRGCKCEDQEGEYTAHGAGGHDAHGMGADVHASASCLRQTRPWVAWICYHIHSRSHSPSLQHVSGDVAGPLAGIAHLCGQQGAHTSAASVSQGEDSVARPPLQRGPPRGVHSRTSLWGISTTLTAHTHLPALSLSDPGPCVLPPPPLQRRCSSIHKRARPSFQDPEP